MTSLTTWLDDVKNLYWFKVKHTGDEMRDYIQGYEDAVNHLRIGLQPEVLTKAQYLNWVSSWRETYSKLSADSRASKMNRKASVVGYDTSNENIARVRALRDYANRMLALRNASRFKAESSYLALRVTEPA